MDVRNLDGAVALVTGASRRAGLGSAVCRALAKRGAAVAFTHWRPADRAIGLPDDDGPEALLAELRRLGARAETIEADLREPGAPACVFDASERGLGAPCTVLVNNAAWSDREDRVEALTAESIDAHLAVNVRATMLLSAEFARRFRGERGTIVSLTTGWSRGAMPGELAYTASKGAVDAFTVQLAAELAPRGIAVMGVDPGPVDTGWMDPPTRARLAAAAAGGRLATPAEVGECIARLAGPAGAALRGRVIRLEDWLPAGP